MGDVRRKVELIEEIAGKQRELKKIEDELIKLEALKPHERIAVGLHDILCRHNHTDGCGWYYEVKDGVHEWNKTTHKDWLKKGVRVDDFINDNDITEDQLFDLVNLTNAL